MAHGTRADTTRHARQRGRAACGLREAQVARGWRGHVVGGHMSPRERLGGVMWQGGWQVKGQPVSGPRLEYWGGNAMRYRTPPFLHAFSSFFLRVGLCPV